MYLKHTKRTLLAAAVIASSGSWVQADDFVDAITSGEVYGDFRLRYEAVDQDNSLKDAKALTLRSMLGYKTGDFYGFSGVLEFEDSRPIAGVDDYNDTLGHNTDYSVVADPQTTEVNQAYIQYKLYALTTKIGRQTIAYDDMRFVSNTPWRQDRQSFNAFTAEYMALEDLSFKYAYINKRNRVFAEERDLRSKDHLLNVSYTTSFGKLTGYAYLLELDNDTDNSLDTYGIRFAGSTKLNYLKLLYQAEYAHQKNELGSIKDDANYYLAEGGVVVSGIKVKVGYEVLGSADGYYGFSTPLAALHKLNGWADQFVMTPAQGLRDLYASVGGQLFGGHWSVIYHDFRADEDTPTIDDLGKEIDLVYSRKFGKHYNAGVKYAAYSAGDKAAGKVDTDKLWFWVGLSF
ncbi:alginate export family protein [Endozoicomonas arenosclerae]|uniref:alginate export family protein n=1 Tax=Endozoicomonas arenosclerae TaxID=1633495 RepID=UPI00078647EE|nr:alginate export family protein [Endozoicomonas arenosclerae]